MPEMRLSDISAIIQEIGSRNVAKVLDAFHNVRLTEADLIGSTGYGYDDMGRDKLEEVYAYVFGGEDAIVRPQITSATHAIYLALRGVVSKDSHVLFWGTPYDTVRPILTGDNPYSLKSNVASVKIRKEPTDDDIKHANVIMMQRSGGYAFFSGHNIDTLAERIKRIRLLNEQAIIVVDNCYGEFVEDREPLHVGADIIVGSLIKNPGGTLAPTGGYIVGRQHLVRNIADFAFSPALGKEVGPTGEFLWRAYQGLFFAPSFVAEALWSKSYILGLFKEHGIEVLEEMYPYSDIIVRIRLGSDKLMQRFVEIIQGSGPVNAHFAPVPERLPGYDHDIIMAAPSFVSGASLELSADGRFAEPYEIYMQPGVSRYHTLVYMKKLLEVLHSEESC